MTCNEHQAQEVVFNIIVDCGVEIRHGHLPGLELATELFVLSIEQRSPAKLVDRTMLGGRHEAGARLVRDARLRPLLERGHQRVVRQILGKSDIAHNPRETGDEPRPFDSKDRVDCAMCIGSRHG